MRGFRPGDRLAEEASDIQGCERKLSVESGGASTRWPRSDKVEKVICGPAGISDGKLLEIARYPSAAAASAAAHEIDQRRLLCVADDAVIESWMYPYDASNEKRADQVAETWARDYCKRVGGRLSGHWNAWKFST